MGADRNRCSMEVCLESWLVTGSSKGCQYSDICNKPWWQHVGPESPPPGAQEGSQQLHHQCPESAVARIRLDAANTVAVGEMTAGIAGCLTELVSYEDY